MHGFLLSAAASLPLLAGIAFSPHGIFTWHFRCRYEKKSDEILITPSLLIEAKADQLFSTSSPIVVG
jgi:hypothetical protein